MKNFTKATLSLVAVLCFTQLSLGQTVNQGAWMVGGSAGFSSMKFKDADNSLSTIVLNPNLGYFIADDLAIGLDVGFVSQSFDGESESTFGLGPSIRYYVTDPIYVTVGANLELDEGGGTTIVAGVGYSWFLNNSVAIEPELFLNLYNNDGDISDYTIFGLSIGVQAFAGRNE
jgi:outer membrane protein